MAQLTAGRQESKNAVSMSDMEIIHSKRTDDELTVSVPAQVQRIVMLTIEFVFDKDLYLESMTVSAKYLTWRDYGKSRLEYTAWNGNCICSTDLHFIHYFFVQIYSGNRRMHLARKEDEERRNGKAGCRDRRQLKKLR